MMENNTNEENFSGVTPENNNTLEMPNNEATESNVNNETNIGIATALENGMNQNTTIGFDSVTPTNNSSVVGFSNTPNSNGNKSSWLLAIVGSLLVVFIGFFVFYINTMGNPKNVFTNIVNTMFTSVENILSSQFNFEESALIEGNVKIESNIDEVEALNKETYDYTFGYDIKNKKAELSAGVKVDNKDRLTAAVNIKDNNMYVYLNELFDKVIIAIGVHSYKNRRFSKTKMKQAIEKRKGNITNDSPIKVKGEVRDVQANLLADVVIKVKGKQVKTNSHGDYVIEVYPTDTLEVFKKGFAPQFIPVDNQRELNIRLSWE